MDWMHLPYEMVMSLWGPREEWYGLNMKCPSQFHVLNSWSLAGDTILKGGKETLGTGPTWRSFYLVSYSLSHLYLSVSISPSYPS
jgi:hypothetical protein